MKTALATGFRVGSRETPAGRFVALQVEYMRNPDDPMSPREVVHIVLPPPMPTNMIEHLQQEIAKVNPATRN